MTSVSVNRPAFVPRPAEGLAYPNAVAMFGARARRSAHQPALRHKRDGAWRTLSWRQWYETSRAVAAGLRNTLGVQRGDRVAILARTRIEWILGDLAIAMAGAVSVPIYPSLTPGDVAYILADSGVQVVLTDHAPSDPPAHDGRETTVRHVVALDPRAMPPRDDAVEGEGGVSGLSFDALCEAGRQALQDADVAEALDDLERGLQPDDVMTIVYTSGTTGEPKGAVLTHENIVYESWAIRSVVPVDHTDEQLLVLPLAHIFARHLVWGAVEQGAVSAVAESEERFAANLQEVAPTFLGAVPRVYERLHARMVADASASGLGKTMFDYCMDVGRRVSVCKQRGQAVPTSLSLKMAVADRVLFRRMRAFFGGRLRYLVSGGAPLSREVAEFFHAAGILILEGYGLSETAGATNVNRPERFRFGTVGPAMPGCEVRVAEDGEVLVRGRNVMRGYWGRDEDTAQSIGQNGWLHTGDLGEIRDGFLRITGRKKSIFKTDTGKYVAPLMVEKRLRSHEGIAHAVVCGEARPHPVALLSLDEEPLLKLSDREGLGCRAYADLATHPRVRQLMQRHIDAVNGSVARHERIHRFSILPRPLSQASGEITPTRKVKRWVVEERYAELIASLY